MILFSGSGSIADAFSKHYPCEIISARKITDDELSSWILKSDVIIHNAAIINSKDIEEFITGNFLLTKRIVDLVYRVKPDIKFINISSMSMLADDVHYLDPDLMSNYALSKFIAEQYCLRHKLKNLINVRFSTIFYSDYKKDGFSKLIYDGVTNKELTIYNNGVAKRDIIPIRVLCTYLKKLSEMEFFSRKINIVSGNAISFKDFVGILQSLDLDFAVRYEKIPANDVLSLFSERDILKIGKIDFTLEDDIKNYIKELNENLNL